MSRVVFYIFFPILFLISLLPFPVLYLLSDFLYFVMYTLVGYRKKVVRSNLEKSFPDWNETQLKKTEKEFYHWLCDLFLEMLKMLTISEKQARKRAKMTNPELVNKYHAEGKSAIWALGHLGNWEWAIFSSDLYTNYNMNVVYHKISNPGFEWMFRKMRTRFGSVVITMEQTFKHLVKNRGNQSITALVSDQNPKPQGAHWTKFLNQDTAFIIGPEKIGKTLDNVILYLNIDRVKRGYYELSVEVISDEPKKTAQGEITEAFVRRLEKDIQDTPAYWLWSHRRWKHELPEDQELYKPVNN